MKFAVLRGLIWGLGVAALALAGIEAIVVLDGGTWTEMLWTGIGVAATYGVCPGFIAFLCHPGARPLIDRIQPWLEPVAPRFLVGLVVGMGAAAMFGLAGIVICTMLHVPPAPGPRGDRLPNWEMRHLAFFAVIGTSAAAFAASVLGAVLAPGPYKHDEAVPLGKHAAWTSIFGAVAGGWIGGGAGLLVAQLSKWKPEFEPTEDMETLLAFAVGLAAGVAAAIVLRSWRNR